MNRIETARLFETYSQDVYRLALSYLRSRQDAEDICQSVFLRLLDQKTLLEEGKEKAWLLTCTANACKNHLKAFWRQNVQEMDESITFTDETDQELWSAVGTLAPKYRVVVHLYYYEGYRQDEIAEILNISRTAVQTRMSRAREQLKKELSEFE